MSKANVQDIKSETHINVEAPPPPYEAAGGATSSTSSNVAIYDVKSGSNPKQTGPSVQPIYNDLHNYHSNIPLQQQQQDGSTVVYIDNNYNLPRDQQCQKPKRTCLEKYWKSVIDPDAWKCAFYFLFIAPVIALFAHIWCAVLFFNAIISLLFPPIGFFFCVGTAWSFRALGRLELVAATMCTSKHKPTHMYPPVFRTTPTRPQNESVLQYGIKICTDKYTWMCLIYFVFINIVYVTFTWSIVLALFVLAFSPLMIVAMPLMCLVCLKFGMWKVRMSEQFLI
jgi:hypothetical protein